MRVAINGFGRIGREVFRINLKEKAFEVVAINDLTDAATLAHLLKYDSTYGTLEQDVSAEKDKLLVGKQKIQILSERDPELLPWKNLKVDLVIEATGFFTNRAGSEKHLKAGAKKVLITAPAKDEIDATIVLGVNEKTYNGKKHQIISNASCTTNCLAPIAKALHDNFKIKKGLMTTIHSYTNDQRILDLPHDDLRRARAANLSMIPTSTGAAKAIGLVIPELKGKLHGIAIRIPTPTVSLVDLTVETEKKTTVEEVNKKLQQAAKKHPTIIRYETKPLVSVDYKGSSHSAIFDALSTEVIGGNLVKVLAWYDNEWGYSSRVVDLVKMVGKKS